MRLALCLVLAAAACSNPPPPERVVGGVEPAGDVVFTINGTIPVHQNMYDAVMERIPAEQRTRMLAAPDGAKRLEEQLSMAQILYGKAIEAGIDKEPIVKVGAAMAERDYLASLYVQREGEKAVTDEAIAKRYEERKVQYARSQIHARHILVKDEAKANEAKAKLAGGADFAAVAAEMSEDPGTKATGGDLGWFEKRRMDPAFSEAAFSAEPRTVVGPISTRFGFHLIEVLDKRESVPLDEVREELAASLRQDAVQKLLSTMQAELKIERKGTAAASAPGPAPAPAAAPGHPGALPAGHPPVQASPTPDGH